MLANVYLHPLDEKLSKSGYKMVRYADDFVILCQSAETAHKALEEVRIRSWYGYFKHACPSTFPRLDGFIRRRLRAILRKQEKRPGMGICRADHTRWPNAYFAQLGLFTMMQARVLASQSR